MHASKSSVARPPRPQKPRKASPSSGSTGSRPAPASPAAGGPSPAVFVVEDDSAIASVIQAFLTRLGYAVAGVAQAGDEALVSIEQRRPDLVLMDIALHGELDGVQTAAVIAARFEIPVVFLTGLADDDTLHRSGQSEAFGYLLKPFEQHELKAAIDLALAKHRTESRLRHVDRWFAAAIRSISDGVIATDRDDHVTFLNPVAERLTGHSSVHALGRPLARILTIADDPPGEFPPGASCLARAGTDHVQFETVLVPADGLALPIECSAAPLRNADGAHLGRIIIFRDVSARRQAEFELTQSHEQLRALAGHLQAAREAERKHIAREIHDQLGQLLTGLRLDLSRVDQQLCGGAEVASAAELRSQVTGALGLVDNLVQEVRRISGELRPGVLDDLGLVAALEWQAREWEQRTRIPCRFQSSHETIPLAVEPRTALFRIFQEALTNISRHAHASQVEGILTCAAGSVRLEISDNGLGFTAPDNNTQTLGLLGMRERAAMAGGTLAVRSSPRGGTTVVAEVPILLPDAA